MRRALTRLFAPVLIGGLVLTACADGDNEEALEADDIVVVDEDDDVVEVDEADGLAIVEGDEESAELVAAAVEDTTAAGSARTRFSTVLSTPQGESRVEGEAVGTGDTATVQLTIAGPTAEAYGADEVEIEVRLLDGVMYQRFPELLAQLDVDAEWISFDLEDLGPEIGAIMEQVQQSEPGEALAALRAVTAVAKVGEEDLDGVETTHYAATIELGDVLDASGVDATAVAGTGINLDQAVPVDVWVDGDGLIRRYDASIDIDGVATTTSFEVLEYDLDVDVQQPPADVTVSFDEAMRQQD